MSEAKPNSLRPLAYLIAFGILAVCVTMIWIYNASERREREREAEQLHRDVQQTILRSRSDR